MITRCCFGFSLSNRNMGCSRDAIFILISDRRSFDASTFSQFAQLLSTRYSFGVVQSDELIEKSCVGFSNILGTAFEFSLNLPPLTS